MKTIVIKISAQALGLRYDEGRYPMRGPPLLPAQELVVDRIDLRLQSSGAAMENALGCELKNRDWGNASRLNRSAQMCVGNWLPQ